MPRAEAWRFGLRALAWLGPFLAAWYACSTWLARPAAWLARAMIGAYGSRSAVTPEFHDGLVDWVTSITVQQAGGALGVIVVEVNTRAYTYGVALFLALVVASRGSVRNALAGVVLLVPFQAWGIAFDAIIQIGVHSGSAVAMQAGIAGWRLEAAALAYQLGSLIFPVLAPVLLWAILERRVVERFAAASAPEGAQPSA